MESAQVDSEGNVQLPEQARRMFAQDGNPETVDVIVRRHRAELWRKWERVRPVAPRGRPQPGKAVGREEFEKAAKRFNTFGRELFSRDEALALYLFGYAIECRLKALICEAQRVGSLHKAQYQLERDRGEEFDILGGQGHDLGLLLALANLHILTSNPDFQEAWVGHVNHWTVAWRYSLPKAVRASAAQYFAAFRLIWDELEVL